MFKFSTEFRKGIFFIRLKGRLDNESYLKEIETLIDNFGIKYTVFNLNDSNSISLEAIECIIQYQKKMLEKQKVLIICDTNRRNRLFKNITKINNELEAFSYI